MLHDNQKNTRFSQGLLKKLVIIVVGSTVAAYGITLALYAGFGGATLAVLWQGISETVSISIGAASFVVALGMILFAFIYDKRQIHMGTVLYQIVYSTCGFIRNLPYIQQAHLDQFLYHVAWCDSVRSRNRAICFGLSRQRLL